MTNPNLAGVIEELWQDLVEKDDRTSPEEYPDMALISRDELADYLARAALRGVSDEPGAGHSTGPHATHVTRDSDASSFDTICINCGAKDVSGGGWGRLVDPCPAMPDTQSREGDQPDPRKPPTYRAMKEAGEQADEKLKLLREVSRRRTNAAKPTYAVEGEDNITFLRKWADDIRRHNGASVDADRLDAIADTLLAGTSDGTTTMSASDPVAWIETAVLAKLSGDTKPNQVWLFQRGDAASGIERTALYTTQPHAEPELRLENLRLRSERQEAWDTIRSLRQAEKKP